MRKLLLPLLCLLSLISSFAQATTVQLPQSGQTIIYSPTDDGDIRAGKSWPNPRFSDTGNQTVIDNLTGLNWAKDANLMIDRDPGFDKDGAERDGAVSWQHALDYIHKLNHVKYLGYNDWRLPNLNELASLVNQGQTGTSTWLNGQGFVSVQSLRYWSSSTNVLSAASAWTVSMDSGQVNYLEKSGYGIVWPVREGKYGAAVLSSINLPKTGQVVCFDSKGVAISCAGTGQDGELQIGAAWPQPRFSDNGDQTVTDNLTGLIWIRDANLMITRDPSFGVNGTSADGAVTWQGALDYVNKLNQEAYLGFSDWRLPNRNELASVMNYVETNPFAWLNWQGIFNVQSNYWTSTTLASFTDSAWNVHTAGNILGESKATNGSGSYVWPVRGAAADTVTSGNVTDTILTPIKDTFQATSVSGPLTTQAVSMAAAVALSVSTASVPAGTVGATYSQTMAATGGTTPYTWSIITGNLPTGLAINSTGVISGTPTIAGTSTFTVQVKDKSRTTAIKAMSIAINAAPLSIATASLTGGYLGTPYSQNLTATGGTTPYTWTIVSGSLPAGLTLGSAGTISGTPTTTGTSAFTVQVRDTANTAVTKLFSLAVTTAPLAVTTASLAAGITETYYNQVITATGGVPPYTWTKTTGTLPTGLSISSAGIISGTPYYAGSGTFTVQATDAVATATTKSLSITVNIKPLAITSTSPINGYVGISLSTSLSATGGTKPYTWSIKSGSLPTGLTLDSTFGSISGTPAVAGTYTYTVQVKDANNKTASKVFTSVIGINVTTISTAALADGFDTVPYSQSLTATGGTAPYNWRHISGNMPDGLALDNAAGIISGIPRGTGTSTVTIQAIDANGGPATKTFAITIKNAPLAINTSALPNGYVTSPYVYSHTLSATGGIPPYNNWTITSGSLPTGLSLDPITGIISGKPASTGEHQFTIQAQDNSNVTSNKSLNIRVETLSMLNSISPLPNAAGTTPASIIATFGESLNPATITNDSMTVSRMATITKVAAGDTHSVVLKDDGTLAAWGSNSAGESSIPAGLGKVVSMAAGGIHTVALKDDGTVITWGSDYSGQASVPAGLSGIVAVAAGDAHTVALKNDGTVVAWGDNSYGQISIPAGLSGIVAVAAGDAHTVALKNDGTVIAWGLNNRGQTTVPAGLSGVVAIAAGWSHTVVLKSDGTVVAWGDNTDGQTAIPLGLTGVSAIAAGGTHTLALTNDRKVVAWGDSYKDGLTSVPVELSGVVGIAAGMLHDMALKSDGTVAVWALKSPATVADGKVLDWEYNDDNQATIPMNLNGVIAVAAGRYHSVALKGDGSAAAWGYNSSSQTNIPAGLSGVVSLSSGGNCTVALKDNGTVLAWPKACENALPSGLSGVTAVAAGSIHALALKNDGTVVAWGDTGFDKTIVPAGLSEVVSVAVGGDGSNIFMQGSTGHSVAVKSDGTVVAWGYNGYAQTTVPDGLSGIVAVAAGWNHTVALKGNGTVVAWGNNFHGQTTVPAGLTNVVAIAAGGEHTVALKSDGTVVAWGYNFNGQINVPAGLTGVVAVAAGDYHTLALKADGTIVSWGSNNFGQTSIPTSPYETQLSGSVTWDPASLTATYLPDAPLPVESSIKASLSQGIRSQAGNRLPSNAWWNFTTAPGVLSIVTASLPDGYTGSAYSKTVAGIYGKPPYAWSMVSGSLPDGLALNVSTGVISGIPSAAGVFNSVILVLDSNNQTASKTFTITVNSPLAIATSALKNGYINSPYSSTLTATGGKAPLAWSISSGALPSGLTLNSSTGGITGTPLYVETSSAVIQAKDANNISVTKSFDVTIMDNTVPKPISASPEVVEFYSAALGSSKTQSLTITNISGSTAGIGMVTPPPAPFSITIDSCSGQNLAPSAQCVISIRFTPSQVTSYNEHLIIAFSDGGIPDYTVPLYGQGIFQYYLPDTGAGESVRNPLSYTLSSATIVTDDNTKLMWQRNPSATPMNWATADNYCKSLTIDGVGNWRLPNFIELTSIVHYGAANPAIDAATFPQTTADTYWTSVSQIYPVATARTVNFLYGETELTDKTATAHVRCVHGAPLVSSMVSSQDALTVYDESSGLTRMMSWLYTTGNPWSNLPALCAAASSARYGGYRDWRMPSIKELVLFDGIDSWSATSSSANTSADALVFSSEIIVSAPKSDDQGTHGLYCVRGGSVASVFNVGDNGNVSVMKISGNFDAKNPDGTYNYQPRKAIATEYFKSHSDKDFLVFLSTFDYAMPEAGAQGFYLEVKNDTQGINRSIFDNSAQFGSPGMLQGTIDLGNVTVLATNPYGSKLEETITTLNHELMHRFGSYVRFKNPDGTLNESLLGKDNAHWSYLLDSKGSLMYGSGWKDNTDGTFTATSARSSFSLLDLYLMGMIPKEQVPPMLLIDNPAIDKTKLPNLGATISGTAKTITIDDIIAAEGERIPNAATSQKQFNVGFVLLTRPGDSAASATQAIETLRKVWAGRFAELTQGKGSVANIPATLEITVDSPTDGATITGPDVTVSGTVINTSGVETGVTVNGMPATVSGNRFVVNHVPLVEGANNIEVKATDANGLTTTSTRSVIASPGNYIRINSNIESGTGPLDITLRLDGSFDITSPQVSISGPASVTLTPGASATEFTASLTVEGTYTFTASAVGPEGQTYSDSVMITVVNQWQLHNQLKAKWDNMRAALAVGDVATAVTNFNPLTMEIYREQFTILSASLPTIAAGMGNIMLVKVEDDQAEYDMRDTINGTEYSFYLLFVKGGDGIWKIRNF